ncbi:TetR/AcrR family transcriptional regulator C-terminal domain-containing protein [Nocardia acidivorans]|uniref:TetR/AcrR family transcriptional regulator C-terminal domain-containing protein n=1 Tax=Nocardia acidivorans TaxID=404580 RepID=UPI0009FCB828|nr:TetR/AcrR family transcriptional regulator C-terminal domain-containing protein [Nocardia acidivorans]
MTGRMTGIRASRGLTRSNPRNRTAAATMPMGADWARPWALYRYFKGTDDLLLAVADELIGRAIAGYVPTGDWRQDLRAIGHRIRDGYLDCPQVATLTMYRTTGRAREAESINTILGVLRGAGFPDAESVRLYHALVDQGMASAAQESCWSALPDTAREAEYRVWDETYPALSPQTYPHLVAVAPLLRDEMRCNSYDYALELFLDAAAARLQALRPRKSRARATGTSVAEANPPASGA